MSLLTSIAGTSSPDVLSVQGIAGAVAIPVSMAAVPTGGATSAKQDTGNVSLASIDSKLTSGIVASVPAVATGGASAFVRISQASINAVTVKATPGTLYSLNVTNNHATNKCFVKVYNKASNPSPSGGADFPAQILCVPPLRKEELILPPCGLNFSVGIAYVIVGAYADNDETAVVLGDVIVSGTYK